MRKLSVFVVVVAVLATGLVGSAAAGAASGVPASDQGTDPDPTVSNGSSSLSSGGETVARPRQAAESCAATPQADDPAEDVIGWHDGYWYDEELSIDDSDGYDQTELDALIARAMARNEALRCWEVNETPPVEVRNRSSFSAAETFVRNVSDAERTATNAQFETLLMIGPGQDAVEVRKQNLGSSVQGYYSPSSDEIVVISDENGTVSADEYTLAHELVHAIQDQRYNLSQYDASLHDRRIAENGLIEGDASLVENRYKQRCAGAWSGTCYSPERTQSGSGLADEGPYLLTFQPYVDGPAWAESLEKRGGWSRLDQAYATPPTTSSEIIHPELYPSDEPVEVTIDDRSAEGWQPLSVESGPDHEVIGEAGLAAMFISPTVETNGRDGIVSVRNAYNLDDSGRPDPDRPFNYNHSFTRGWAGDRMQVYTGEDGESATIWKLAWDSAADRKEFTDKYEQLLSHRGAEQLESNGTVYRFTEDSEFEGAIAIVPDGNTVTIVDGPSAGALAAIYGGAPDDVGAATSSVDNDSVPGFGPMVAVLALLGFSLAHRRRR